MYEIETIEKVRKQEEILRFNTVSFKDLKRIGDSIVKSIEEKDQSAYVEIYVNGLIVYAVAMDGSSKNNALWAKRKRNTCIHYSKSSLLASYDLEKKNRKLSDAALSEMDYAAEPGSFPVLLFSGVCVGCITVSGMTSYEDHQVIADCLAKELGISGIPSIL